MTGINWQKIKKNLMQHKYNDKILYYQLKLFS